MIRRLTNLIIINSFYSDFERFMPLKQKRHAIIIYVIILLILFCLPPQKAAPVRAGMNAKNVFQ
jgi:hypothetical protein